jgi:flagellum-specific peptidoglycan hydrolase FlgJ
LCKRDKATSFLHFYPHNHSTMKSNDSNQQHHDGNWHASPNHGNQKVGFAHATEANETPMQRFQQFFDGLKRIWANIKHNLFLDTHFGTIVKISILGIFMFVVFTQDLHFGSKNPKFAATNGKATKTSYSGDNPFAPTDAKDIATMEVTAFIDRYSKIAVAEMDKFQIPASISMGQAIIESRAGKSILATKNNNMFGIKCFLKPGANATCGKTHCTNHFDDSGKDFFRKYENGWDSWREHSQFLTKDRYQPLFKAGKDYKAWAKGLREFGYATDPDYEKKLISVIERYKLYKLDEL